MGADRFEIGAVEADRVLRVVDARTGAVVLDRVQMASGPWRSFKGLMFDRALPPGHGLLFRPARGIHTHFMRFPIDLIYLDGGGTVIRVRSAMPPWRFDLFSAPAVIEANAGVVAAFGLAPGRHLRWEAIDRPLA